MTEIRFVSTNLTIPVSPLCLAWFPLGHTRRKFVWYAESEKPQVLIRHSTICVVDTVITNFNPNRNDEMKNVSDSCSYFGAKIITLILTGFTMFLAFLWWYSDCGDYEPIVTISGILAGFSALVFDPMIAANKEFKRILTAVEDECEANKETLLKISDRDQGDLSSGIAYARLWTFAIEQALTSGLFSKHPELMKIMESCRINFSLLNGTLLIVELRMKSADQPGNEFIHCRIFLDSPIRVASMDCNNFLDRQIKVIKKTPSITQHQYDEDDKEY